jgi:hypothetical protein
LAEHNPWWTDSLAKKFAVAIAFCAEHFRNFDFAILRFAEF